MEVGADCAGGRVFWGGLIPEDNVKLSEKYFCVIEAKSSDISRQAKRILCLWIGKFKYRKFER